MNEVSPMARQRAKMLVKLALEMLRLPTYFKSKRDPYRAQIKCAEMIESAWAIIHGEPDPYPPKPTAREFEKRLKQVTMEEWKEAVAPLVEKIERSEPADVPNEFRRLESTWCEKCGLYHVAGISVCPHDERGKAVDDE